VDIEHQYCCVLALLLIYGVLQTGASLSILSVTLTSGAIMEAIHRIVMNNAVRMALRDGLELSPVEDFAGKGSCLWLTATHDAKVCFFVQGEGDDLRCGFLLPETESTLMELLDIQLANLTIKLAHRHNLFNHSMNRSSVNRGDRVNSRIYLNYQDIGFSDAEDQAGVMYQIIKSLIPPIVTYATLRGLIDYKLQVEEAKQ
jgi:hypothetical protein